MKQLCHRTYRPKRQEVELGYKKSNKYSPYYGSKIWHQLREWKSTNFPLCEACLLKDISTPMEEVHHLRVFMSGKNKDEKWELFTNPHNLASLCKYHHKLMHKMLSEYDEPYATLKQLIDYENSLNLKQT